MSKITLAAKLETEKGRILTEWQSFVKTKVDAAKNQTSVELRDSLPEFLNSMSQVLLNRHQSTQELRDLGSEHGEDRFNLEGYTLPQIVDEYTALRKVIIDSVKQEILSDFQSLHFINESIDIGIRHAVDAFSEKERHQDKSQVVHLESKQKAQDQAMAAMSHDLQNPIGTALMAADILSEKHENPEDTKEYSEILVRNLEHAKAIIHDLLDVSRSKAGYHIALRIEQVNLTDLLKSIVDDFSPAHPNKFIFEMNSKEEVHGWWCSTGLRRVFENLLENAVKYGSPNSPITLSLNENDNAVNLRVHNLGSFIPSEDQEHIFEAFFRRQTPEVEKLGGWGLGLSLVRGIVESHKGTIKVESSPEDGTSFIVTLPKDSR